jgi:hypothetical protein
VDGNVEDRSGTVSLFDGPNPEIINAENEKAEQLDVAKWLAAALQREDARPYEAGDRDDAARRSRFRKPRGMFNLFSICAGHSSSSGRG